MAKGKAIDWTGPGMRIQPGTTVTWKSQANAGRKVKTGVVVVFVPANTDVLLLPETENLTLWPRQFDHFAASVDRYLVRVDRQGKRHALDPVYYMPLAGVIERQN